MIGGYRFDLIWKGAMGWRKRCNNCALARGALGYIICGDPNGCLGLFKGTTRSLLERSSYHENVLDCIYPGNLTGGGFGARGFRSGGFGSVASG
jgi:hypothetical protein